MFSLICAWIEGWISNRQSGYLRRHRAHYDIIVMTSVVKDPLYVVMKHKWEWEPALYSHGSLLWYYYICWQQLSGERSGEVPKGKDMGLELYHQSQTWQSPRHYFSRYASQVWKRYNSFIIRSRGFETSLDLVERRFIAKWIVACRLVTSGVSSRIITTVMDFRWDDTESVANQARTLLIT